MTATGYVENPVRIFPKDPDAKLSYGFNLTDWLDGDTIADNSWTKYPASGTLTIESDAYDDSRVLVTLSGGAVGETYDLTAHWTTHNGDEDNRTFRVNIEER